MNHDNINAFLRFSRAYAAEQLSWFAPALFRCTIIITEKVPVAAIDEQLNIYFNPIAIADIKQKYELKKALAQVGFLWIHEISHILREHAERAKDLAADSHYWNMAADFEINDSHWEGLMMPIDYPGLLPQEFGFPIGQLAEVYYKNILKQKKQKLIDKKQLPFDEGSGVHGQSRPWEEKAKTTGKGQKNATINKLIIDIIRKEVAEKMKAQGNLPGRWARWVDDILQAKIDWRKALRHRIKTAINTSLMGKIDYSYKKPNRRQSVLNPIILPALMGDYQAKITVIIDTSGSINKKMLGQAVGEVCSMLNTFRIPVTIIPCDMTAHAPIVIQSSSDYTKLKELPGGGGTDMNAGIDAAMALQPAPDVIIVLTDGYTPWPLKRLPVALIFGILHHHVNKFPKPSMPPWSEDCVVGIDLEALTKA